MFLFDANVFVFIFGYTPDTADIFIFGLLLVFLTIGLRWILNHNGRKTDN